MIAAINAYFVYCGMVFCIDIKLNTHQSLFHQVFFKLVEVKGILRGWN